MFIGSKILSILQMSLSGLVNINKFKHGAIRWALFVTCYVTNDVIAAEISWAGPNGGNWNVAANWSPNKVPGSGDSATIGGVNVQVTGNVSVRTLTLFEASTLSVAPGSVLNLVGGGSFYGVLTNAGTINWSGSGDITLYNVYYPGYSYTTGGFGTPRKTVWVPSRENTGGVVNLVSGLFNVQSDQALNVNSNGGGGYPLFSNAGTFRKSAGMGTNVVFVNFSNSGTVDVRSGTLSLKGRFVNSGAVDVKSGTLSLEGGAAAVEISMRVRVARLFYKTTTALTAAPD